MRGRRSPARWAPTRSATTSSSSWTSAASGGSGVLRDPQVPTSATVVLVDSAGERTFLHVPGANGALRAEELDDELVYAGRALHLAGALVLEQLDGEPLARLAAEARSRGLLTSLDPVWDPTARWSRLEPCLPHLDLFLPSLGEGQALSGEQEPARVAALAARARRTRGRADDGLCRLLRLG